MINDNFKGFALFSDVMDASLRANNRAAVLANIVADNMQDGKLSPKGVTLTLGYFAAIPKEERAIVQPSFVSKMKERGYELA